jgi:predicted amidohydrolase
MNRPVGVGLAQFGSSPGDADANRAASTNAAKTLFGRGADIVVLPELSVPWYSTDAEELVSGAESISGPTVQAWRSVAADHSALIVGGFCERDGDALYNTAVAVDGSGVIGHYRKLHLFADEKNSFTPGDRGLPVVETPVGRIGLCICYDLRFVEVVRVLALSGAELICVPTAWLPGFDAERWDADGMCPQAIGAVLQANLSQVFIACASQVGAFPSAEFLGSSLVVDPFGRRASGPLSGRDDTLDVVTVDLDDAVRAQDRGAQIRPRADRRTDVYGLSYGGRTL